MVTAMLRCMAVDAPSLRIVLLCTLLTRCNKIHSDSNSDSDYCKRTSHPSLTRGLMYDPVKSGDQIEARFIPKVKTDSCVWLALGGNFIDCSPLSSPPLIPPHLHPSPKPQKEPHHKAFIESTAPSPNHIEKQTENVFKVGLQRNTP